MARSAAHAGSLTLPADILPDTARVGASGHLEIGGCDVVDLAARHGTPLYVYDEASLRTRARALVAALSGYPATAMVCYAAKAYCAPWLLRMVADEGLGLDVVSAGELHAAARGGFPRERIFFHGNDKTPDEIELGIRERVARFVVDNVEEIDRLAAVARAAGIRQPVLLRINPGVNVRTHGHLQTGALDSKFGFALASADAAIARTGAQDSLDLVGLHAHIGSQLGDLSAYAESIDRLFDLARRTRLALRELNIGGGFAVRYVPREASTNAAALAKELAATVARAARSVGIAPPTLVIEPGRSLVAMAAVALYRVGSIKEIPGVRTYVAVDGGMADNIRPTAYGAEYTAVLANRMNDPASATVAIAGRYCESGDVLIREVALPPPHVGDLVAIPVAGAYQLAMASNYNMVPRPAVAVVADGRARVVTRRETYDDLLARDAL